jgi:antitoxin (DNA-binding transcriptional repressor) of toxin-antitoxin stability system
MALTASRLRENIYRVLDQVLETGVPVEIARRGRILRIVPAGGSVRAKLDRLVERPDYLRCKPEAIVHLDWSKRWRP